MSNSCLALKLEGFINLLMGQYRQGHRAVRTMISALFPSVALSQGLISKVKARTAALLFRLMKHSLKQLLPQRSLCI
jgi:hypothetical protein